MVSFTTDMGTELGMSGFRMGDLSGLLPEWLQQPFQTLVADGEAAEQVATGACEDRRELEADGDAEAVAGPLLEEDGDVFESPPPGDRGAAAREPQRGAGGASEQDQYPGGGAPRGKSRREQLDADERDGSAGAGILMPNAIPIPGMLHILSNLLEDVDSHMVHWDVYWQQLKNAAALLCNSMRLERMIALCFPGPLSEYRSGFSGKIPVPYLKRWGSVTFF